MGLHNSSAPTQTILIAEDEPFFARMCARALVKPWRTIQIVHDGEAALEEIQKSSPDLLLLDLVLEKADGFSVLEYLREKHSSLPVIIFSNLGQNIDERVCKNLGVCDYFLKSETSLEDLAKKVDRFLQTRASKI